MGFQSLLEAGLLSGALLASHEGSHQRVANDKGMPLKWDGPAFTFDNASPRDASELYGAGFSGQDSLKSALAGTEKGQLFSAINAAHKLSYLIKDRGDIEGLEKESGNKSVKALLTASILSDLATMKNPKSNNNFKFTTIDGAPGLLFNKRF